MTTNGIDIARAIENAKKALDEDGGISSTSKATINLLITIITLLVNRLGLNSSNSSKPPSTDPKDKKKKKRKKSTKKPGGQKGHKGARLEPVDEPDEVIEIPIDRRTIPSGEYTEGESVKRQVFDIVINKVVIEYQAQVLVDKDGNEFVAEFPAGVDQPTQYGPNIKANVVYDSQGQLIPVERIAEDFADNAGMPISTGFIHNCVKGAYDRLEKFEVAAKNALTASPTLNADETGINVNGKNIWLHGASSNEWTLFMPHEKRGKEAMDEMGILPFYQGNLCHDHWKPYFSYGCDHSLCNAHHLRELERTYEQDGCKWALEIQDLLLEINKKKLDSNDTISKYFQNKYRLQYREILANGEKETPPPDPPPKGKKGRQKKTKARNLLERLRDFESETLRFMTRPDIPFTNNLSERDIRMTKVQQKISGCFRSMDGAKYFSRIRSFISTVRKRGLSPAIALRDLFSGKLPDFIQENLPSAPE